MAAAADLGATRLETMPAILGTLSNTITSQNSAAVTGTWRADPHCGPPYDAVNWTAPPALILEGETDGLSPAAETRSPGRVIIPMAKEVGSLNAAMAATVVLFEAARQRRNWTQSNCTKD